ncbi:2-alkenal reductase (NADP(+)-dependent)-like [Olea europaea subsp. europaea]|uniref:2-alkenal reductase (NADP(+)-dependent)-like n=1 Tax=Olea europaea subsp. europaea TaxID=158383 RepID=A0A8S0UX91_OLEEU|nr:2-alkenal reductase (NADP(+)-dependent)-like [Olea europaea subsp. europaea]
MGSEEVSNRQIVLNDYIIGFLKESDMSLKTSLIKLKVPADSPNAILVKNYYLSCDPYMRSRMQKNEGSYIESFNPGTILLFIDICTMDLTPVDCYLYIVENGRLGIVQSLF